MIWFESLWLTVAAVGAFLGGGWAFFFVCLNLGVLTLFGWDKHAAVKETTRVPEKELLFWTFLGGSAGAMVGILLFHHKGQKRSIKLPVLGCFIAHCLVLAAS